MNFSLYLFLNITLQFIATFSTLIFCRNKAFESDNRVELIVNTPGKSYSKPHTPTAFTPPTKLPVPKNKPVSPADPEEDTLADVKSLKTDDDEAKDRKKKTKNK